MSSRSSVERYFTGRYASTWYRKYCVDWPSPWVGADPTEVLLAKFTTVPTFTVGEMRWSRVVRALMLSYDELMMVPSW